MDIIYKLNQNLSTPILPAPGEFREPNLDPSFQRTLKNSPHHSAQFYGNRSSRAKRHPEAAIEAAIQTAIEAEKSRDKPRAGFYTTIKGRTRSPFISPTAAGILLRTGTRTNSLIFLTHPP
jgi:hypothetical protein